jgi:hypothetical protein
MIMAQQGGAGYPSSFSLRSEVFASLFFEKHAVGLSDEKSRSDTLSSLALFRLVEKFMHNVG